jgi:hypothetical protein
VAALRPSLLDEVHGALQTVYVVGQNLPFVKQPSMMWNRGSTGRSTVIHVCAVPALTTDTAA